ncbi:hypothetical protein FBEOM_2840 [Fusarium beomiforme]|uniref:Uncharacterized protein n=1 Tax=Fusarium beomiforme TaxID=44412 RepID=A0A9P5AR99_9HYPO|nr:hypothetical protein FBEOM_2840 [Fusarium beomiforme]
MRIAQHNAFERSDYRRRLDDTDLTGEEDEDQEKGQSDHFLLAQLVPTVCHYAKLSPGQGKEKQGRGGSRTKQPTPQ